MGASPLLGEGMSMSAVAAYVQQREGEHYVGDSRVTVHSVIAAWKRGAAPEDVAAAFPTLPLVAIYGTITYIAFVSRFPQHRRAGCLHAHGKSARHP